MFHRLRPQLTRIKHPRCTNTEAFHDAHPDENHRPPPFTYTYQPPFRRSSSLAPTLPVHATLVICLASAPMHVCIRVQTLQAVNLHPPHLSKSQVLCTHLPIHASAALLPVSPLLLACDPPDHPSPLHSTPLRQHQGTLRLNLETDSTQEKLRKLGQMVTEVGNVDNTLRAEATDVVQGTATVAEEMDVVDQAESMLTPESAAAMGVELTSLDLDRCPASPS